jgi:thiamine phosphate phosphatase / amino-HMP aminohydrolase
MDSEGTGTGKLSKRNEDGIRTGYDKLREMKKVLKQNESSHPIVTVYVGDSNTDLPCLLHADIGLIIGNQEGLRETCARVGIKVESGISLREINKKQKESEELRLFQFDDWHAIVKSGLLE